MTVLESNCGPVRQPHRREECGECGRRTTYWVLVERPDGCRDYRCDGCAVAS